MASSTSFGKATEQILDLPSPSLLPSLLPDEIVVLVTASR
jgi:hypothetical protein